MIFRLPREWKSSILLTLSLAFVFSARLPLAGQTAPPPGRTPLLTFSGFADGYLNYSYNDPASALNLYRNFDTQSNRFALNMAKLTVTHDADPVGFRIDAGAGRAMGVLNFFDDANGFRGMRYLPQAYVTLKPKSWKGLQVDFGKFYTSAGAELTETYLGWNYSRALLYANGPYYHFGLRTSMPVTSKLTLGVQVINGWNNVDDQNSGKSLGFTALYAEKTWSIAQNYYTGPEKYEPNDGGWRNFSDTVINFTPGGKWSSYVNLDIGHEQKAFGDRGARFWGISNAHRFQLTDRVAVAGRIEHYNDVDGFITGGAKQINEFTATAEYAWEKSALLRAEYRVDWSNVAAFEKGGRPGAVKSQPTFVVGLVTYFGPKR
jgi:hypothetical protein